MAAGIQPIPVNCKTRQIIAGIIFPFIMKYSQGKITASTIIGSDFDEPENTQFRLLVIARLIVRIRTKRNYLGIDKTPAYLNSKNILFARLRRRVFEEQK